MSSDSPLFLSVDTATSCSSIALSRGNVHQGEIVATLSLNSRVTHSRRLLTGIDWLLGESNISLTDIEALAVGLGPGSFTGLRIAMATVKGLAFAMDKPLYGVSTLDALALNCSGDKALCVLVDARKKEVYRRWYRQDEKNTYRAHGDISAVAALDVVKETRERTLFVGDGLLAYGKVLQEQLGESMIMAPRSLFSPSAAAVGLLCCELLESGEGMDLQSLVPLYVRASDAELNLGRKTG